MIITGFKVKNNKTRSIDFNKRNSDLVLNALLTTTIISDKASARTNIAESVMPLVEVLQDLAEPISYGFCIKGFLQIMAGDEHNGMKAIKSSVGGFIGIRWLPSLFGIVKKINF